MRISVQGWLYDTLQKLLGGERAQATFATTIVEHSSGSSPRLLDLGCGTGRLLGVLPANFDYLGIDLDPVNLEFARRRHPARGRFVLADAARPPAEISGPFDAIVAQGLLHHLDDQQADSLTAFVAGNLTPGGHFFTVDPTFHPGQPWIARALANRDNGRFIRRPEDYRRLLGARLRICADLVAEDRLRLPYSHYLSRSARC